VKITAVTAPCLHRPGIEVAAFPTACVRRYRVEPPEIAGNIAKEPFALKDGDTAAPETPGLGLEPDLDTVERSLVGTL
jgi:L-alanine-DL-glutamate epimerase-like enolase superfamily enzyme